MTLFYPLFRHDSRINTKILFLICNQLKMSAIPISRIKNHDEKIWATAELTNRFISITSLSKWNFK
jgi:hypothetical protein